MRTICFFQTFRKLNSNKKISKTLVILFFLLVLVQISKSQESPQFYWLYHVIDDESPTGTNTTLVYDSQGLPSISYTRANNKGIMLARFDGLEWQVEVVDPSGQGRARMTLDANDNPHIVYGADDQSKIMYAYHNGQSWDIKVIDTALKRGQAWYERAIQVDSNGDVHITYGIDHVVGENSIKQMTYAFLSGSEMSVRNRIDSLGINGKWSDMVLNSLAKPITVYWTTQRSNLIVSYLENDIWKREIIDDIGELQGYYPSIKLGNDGNFYISFQNHSTGRIRLAYGQPGQWQVEDITDLDGWTTLTTPSPLALDDQDNLYVAFHSTENGDLQLAYKINNDVWKVEAIDTVGTVGEHTSIAITPEGLPAVSYYDATNGYLRLAVASLTPPEDADNDGVPDYLEKEYGTKLLDVDSDDDGLSDGEEDLNRNGLVENYETDPRNPDTDGDGIQDGTEAGRSAGIPDSSNIMGTDMVFFVPDSDPSTTTDNLQFDSDSDGLSDGAEDKNANGRVDIDESDPNNSDSDGDGLTDGIEVEHGLSPLDIDSDDDGLSDPEEDKDLDGLLDSNETSPALYDTDGDGISDGIELGVTNPVPDPDGPGRLVSTNVAIFKPDADPATTTDPNRPDTDRDGLKDGDEDKDRNGRFDAGETDPLKDDTDGDGLKDGTEIASGSDPVDLDSDDDGIADGIEDSNQNGRFEMGETSPTTFDSDGDGLSDGLELGFSMGVSDPDGMGPLKGTDNSVFVADSDPTTTTDPLVWDTDNDGLADGEEDSNFNGSKNQSETDPLKEDTDDDGVTDGDEVSFHSDPLNPSDKTELFVLLSDNFSESTLDQWTIIDEGDIEGPSQWTTFDNSLVQSSNIYGGIDYTGVDDPNKPGTYIWRGSTTWIDSKISFKMRSDDNDGLGVMFRYSNSDNYYRFSMNREKQFARITRFHNGQATILDKQLFEYEVGRWYPVLIYAVDSRIQIYIDGKRMFDAQDDKLTAGAFAFYSWRNAGSWFKDLLIEGDELIVSVKPTYIAEFRSELKENDRILRWRLGTRYPYNRIELRRIEQNGRDALLLMQEYENSESVNASTRLYIDTEPWLAQSYTLLVKDAQGDILDSQNLHLDMEGIEDFALTAAYPNPFRGHANLILQAPRASSGRFRVYNILGQIIRKSEVSIPNAGFHRFFWDGKDSLGRNVPRDILFAS